MYNVLGCKSCFVRCARSSRNHLPSGILKSKHLKLLIAYMCMFAHLCLQTADAECRLVGSRKFGDSWMLCGVVCGVGVGILHASFLQNFYQARFEPEKRRLKGKFIFYVRFARNLQLATAQHPKNICSIGAILKVRDLIGIRHCASYSNSKPLRLIHIDANLKRYR